MKQAWIDSWFGVIWIQFNTTKIYVVELQAAQSAQIVSKHLHGEKTGIVVKGVSPLQSMKSFVDVSLRSRAWEPWPTICDHVSSPCSQDALADTLHLGQNSCRSNPRTPLRQCGIQLHIRNSIVCACKILRAESKKQHWRSEKGSKACASRHNGVHFLDISTSKSGLNPSVFYTFDFEMCFAPQRRAIFHLSSPDGPAPAALASLLFDPPEPQIIRKIQCFATFLPFRAPGSSLFGDFLFFDLLSSFLLFSDSSHVCFSNCPDCRKFDF